MAGLLAVLFVLYIVLSTTDPWSAVADRSRATRVAYGAFFLLVGAVLLALIYARVHLTNPALLVSGAVFALICLFDWTARRRLKRRELIAAK
jgi:hypothetical protein